MTTLSEWYTEYRCHECAKLLFKGLLVDSEVSVKCTRCGKIGTFQGVAASEYYCPRAKECTNNPRT